MIRAGDTIQLSASDLVGHLNCRHLTQLDLAVARGAITRPERWDPALELLRERGARHETRVACTAGEAIGRQHRPLRRVRGVAHALDDTGKNAEEAVDVFD